MVRSLVEGHSVPAPLRFHELPPVMKSPLFLLKLKVRRSLWSRSSFVFSVGISCYKVAPSCFLSPRLGRRCPG